jgi:hypothetical protein
MKRTVPLFLAAALMLATTPLTLAFAQGEAQYVGSSTCGGCHEKEYNTFMKYAKKAKSDKSVKTMAKKLAPAEVKECYVCHTTGYGKPGGFVSYEKTPELGHAGCEVCHGPGAAHVDSGGSKAKIKGAGRMSVQECEKCHNSERVSNFRFKPMLHGGAH